MKLDPPIIMGGAIWFFRLTLYKNSKRKYEMYSTQNFGGGVHSDLLNMGMIFEWKLVFMKNQPLFDHSTNTCNDMTPK